MDGPSSSKDSNVDRGPSSSSTTGRQFIPPPVDSSRVVSRPVPKAQAEDPRDFQIKQLKRRFSPTERSEDGGTAFAFQMVPSDPDFPFEMLALECVLHVPATYPKDGRPSLDVKNKNMGRGYQINVERGFTRLAERAQQSTLLGLMNALDRQLEILLAEPKAETITIIPNNDPGKIVREDKSVRPQENKAVPSNSTKNSRPPEIYTPEQRRLASERREAETRQLEARVGRLLLFSKSSDGIAYTVPITPRKHEDLPVPLQAVKTIKLFVPLLYPLQNCRIEIQGVSREAAQNTEKGFERKVKETLETTLMGHVNYLAQNMHVLAVVPFEESKAEEDDVPDVSSLQVGDTSIESEKAPAAADDEDRSHIRIIPRPPEWGVDREEEGSSDSDFPDSYDSGDEFSDEDGDGVPLPMVPETSTSTAPERGISLSFPFLELYSIELLELVSLYITIKCQRCKDTMDISNLRTNGQRSESCKKCAMPLSIGYRRELMHTNSVRAGYLDLDGCTVVDMLPR
ncbi:hypothetical protein MMC28_000342 [Mycoblastus sanguinarius]|nr:hypothetical protein [Mycoblastus sanguinarius]